MRGREESTLSTDEQVQNFSEEIRAAADLGPEPNWDVVRAAPSTGEPSIDDLWFAQLLRHFVTGWPELADGLDYSLMHLLRARKAMQSDIA